MKKLCLLLCLLSLNALAAEPELQWVQQELEALTPLEERLSVNSTLTFDDVQAEFPQLAENMDMAPASAFLEVTGDTLGIPPFLWGCILGVIGILLVYIISDNNKEATRKALVGCLVGYGTALVVYLILVFAVWGSFAAAASSI